MLEILEILEIMASGKKCKKEQTKTQTQKHTKKTHAGPEGAPWGEAGQPQVGVVAVQGDGEDAGDAVEERGGVHQQVAVQDEDALRPAPGHFGVGWHTVVAEVAPDV